MILSTINDIQFKILEDDLKEYEYSLIQCYKKAFSSDKSYSEISKFWNDKHENNPLGKSFVFVAQTDNRIIGILAFQRNNYFKDGKTIEMLQACDSCVLEEYRGKKIFSNLVMISICYFEEHENDFHGIIGFPNVSNSFPGYIKLNWKNPFNMENLVLACKNGNIFKNKFLKLLSPILSLQKLIIYSTSLLGKFTFNEIPFNSFKDCNNLCANFEEDIEEDYFDYLINLKQIKFINILQKDKVIGSILYSIDGNNHNKYVRIHHVYLASNKNKYRILANGIKQLFSINENVSYIRFWGVKKSKYYRMLKILGFYHSKHLNPFIYWALQEDFELSEKDCINFSFINLDY